MDPEARRRSRMALRAARVQPLIIGRASHAALPSQNAAAGPCRPRGYAHLASPFFGPLPACRWSSKDGREPSLGISAKLHVVLGFTTTHGGFRVPPDPTGARGGQRPPPHLMRRGPRRPLAARERDRPRLGRPLARALSAVTPDKTRQQRKESPVCRGFSLSLSRSLSLSLALALSLSVSLSLSLSSPSQSLSLSLFLEVRTGRQSMGRSRSCHPLSDELLQAGNASAICANMRCSTAHEDPPCMAYPPCSAALVTKSHHALQHWSRPGCCHPWASRPNGAFSSGSTASAPAMTTAG